MGNCAIIIEITIAVNIRSDAVLIEKIDSLIDCIIYQQDKLLRWMKEYEDD